MKIIVEEVENEGLESLLGKRVTLFCGVYETGPFSDNAWKDSQSLANKYWYVTKQSIESFGILK